MSVRLDYLSLQVSGVTSVSTKNNNNNNNEVLIHLLCLS